jgi:hypothetical protein
MNHCCEEQPQTRVPTAPLRSRPGRVRSLAALLTLGPALAFGAQGPGAADILPVIPPPAPATTTPAPALPNAPDGPSTASATTTPAAGITGPKLAGNWQATEVIVFDRPMVGLEPKGERLLSDAPRTLPARLTSFESPGLDGGVIYLAAPDGSMCLAAPGGLPPAGGLPGTNVPTAFTRPTRRADPAPAQSAPPPASPPAALPAPADPLAELQRALRDYEDALVEQSLTWLPTQADTLAAGARRLAEQGGYQILFHRTWIQNLAAREPAPLIFVQSARNAEGLALLEGTLRIRRERGLRFDTTLWYRAPDAEPADVGYIAIREERRLGEGQVHYIDHPKLGIIVRTTEVGVPASITEAWAALSAPVE